MSPHCGIRLKQVLWVTWTPSAAPRITRRRITLSGPAAECEYQTYGFIYPTLSFSYNTGPAPSSSPSSQEVFRTLQPERITAFMVGIKHGKCLSVCMRGRRREELSVCICHCRFFSSSAFSGLAMMSLPVTDGGIKTEKTAERRARLEKKGGGVLSCAMCSIYLFFLPLGSGAFLRCREVLQVGALSDCSHERSGARMWSCKRFVDPPEVWFVRFRLMVPHSN